MDKSLLVSNPFALMMNPDEVLQAMQHSDRLDRLQRRVCKPLDKPLVAKATDTEAFDHEVDDSEVDDSEGVASED